jgi:hypothetical protein
MYEFLKEAGWDHEKKFFEKVRFFSAVAMYDGVVIRVHWAKKTDNTKYKPIPGANNREAYPLQFEYEQFWPPDDNQLPVSKPHFDRQTIVQQIENIINSYGANDLFPILQGAAKRVSEKFSKDEALFMERASQFYYMHGQVPLKSKTTTRANTPLPVGSNTAELSALPPPRRPAETYKDVVRKQLMDMCRLRGITIGRKTVDELRKNLQEDDLKKAAAANPGPSGAQLSVMTPPMPSTELASPSILNQFRRLRARSVEGGLESPSKRQRFI